MRLRNILILVVILAVLAGVFYYFNRPVPAPEKKPQLYVWLIEMEDITHIKIILPREDLSQSFAKAPDRSWRFDDPEQTPVDMKRWGGGIPLLLSGPGLNRVITENAPAEKLVEFGLTRPRMEVILTLNNGEIINITVGDSTPDGSNFYVQVPDSNAVATVDISWYQVIERLVKEPPYVPASEK